MSLFICLRISHSGTEEIMPKYTTEINRLLISIGEDWDEFSQESGVLGESGEQFDYAVISSEGDLLYYTKEGISTTVSAATGHFDIIRDIEVNGIVVKGYENSGKTLIIADPAANSSALNSSWKVLTNSTYKVNINEFYAFIGNGSHGIVYHK